MAHYIHTEQVHNTGAAEIIVPLLIEKFKPASVLDVGCGIGTWLKVFSDHGVTDVAGIDGDYVDHNLLGKYMDLNNFVEKDLSQPFNLSRKFDLVICLEVAEHLPEKSAEAFVKSITNHGDNVLFSAAVPYQGGQNHLNEQWPSYWARHFQSHGYEPYDVIRPLIWNNSGIDVFYRQNPILYSKSKVPYVSNQTLDMILPDFWELRMEKEKNLKHRLERITEGKVGISYYLKLLFKSLGYFGKKVG